MSKAKRVKTLARINGLFIAILALSAAPAKAAAIYGTYVDADPTGGSPNTIPSTAFPSSFTYAGDYGDNLWDVRSGFGANNTVIEAGGNTENPPLITTSVTGLTSGNYDVFVLFGAAINPAIPGVEWSVRAALHNGTLVEYDKNTPGIIDVGLFPGSSAIELYEAKVGTVSSATSFSVDLRNSTRTSVATFYDGVAYAPVPEPSSIALLSTAALFLVRRRAHAREL
jgi:hypothetical protein